MDFTAVLSASDQAKVNMQVNTLNKSLNGGKVASRNLDKDDFLKILITQLSYQDPTKPLEDKEFISQMAQFSSLEQMTNMSNSFSNLSGMLVQSNALNLLGKNVEITTGETIIKGVVEEITGRDHPQIKVNGKYYDFNDVEKITNKGAAL
ncbi:MAG: flagellar hook assembly protein FlgD [Spirochaetes bacterium]|nr:MAG: flagellar hook assembly protein FlgD [Spirochaetota bacterium]